MDFSRKYYVIKSGKLLDALKKYRDEKEAVRQANVDYAISKGADQYFANHRGKLTALQWKSRADIPEGWTKPSSRGGSHPYKKNKVDREEMEALPQFTSAVDIIQEITGVPLSISYEATGVSGSGFLGSPLRECGFMWAEDEFYAMWTPDVEATVAYYKEQYPDVKFKRDVDKWKMDVEGVEPILEEEWDLMVAEYKARKAREAKKEKEDGQA